MLAPVSRILSIALIGLLLTVDNCAFAEAIKSSISTHASASEVQSNLKTIELREFFKTPIGPQGLEPSRKLLSLNNSRVRLVGYQVKEEEPQTGVFMLTATPVSLAEVEDGPADDLPAATVFVHMPAEDAQKIVAYRDGHWALTGTLQVGNQEERNGRVSYVRLLVEKPETTAAK